MLAVIDLDMSKAESGEKTVEDVYPHRVGVSMLMAKRAKQALYLDDTDARTARRFNRWLEDQVRSSVRVIAPRPAVRADPVP